MTSQAVKNLVYLALPLYQRDCTMGRVPTAVSATARVSDRGAQPNGAATQNGNAAANPAPQDAACDASLGSETDSDEDDGIAGRAAGTGGVRDGGATLHGIVRRTAKLADDRRAPQLVNAPPYRVSSPLLALCTLFLTSTCLLRSGCPALVCMFILLT